MKNKSQSPLPPPSKKIENSMMGFANAMQAIINGKKIHRREWTDEEEYCLLKDNFLMIHREGKFHTWIVSEGDLMGIDWVVVK